MAERAEPKVFLDYTQAELDRAYDQLAYAPDRDAILARQLQHSEAARARFKPEIVRYGDGPLEDMEVFCSSMAGSGRARATAPPAIRP